MDVPKYVTWNNCDSTKYSKIVKNAVKDVTYPPALTLRKKKQAPPPPLVPHRRRPRRNTSEESQLLHQDISTKDDYLDQTVTKSTTEISDINSSGSLTDAQELSSALSTINIHAMEEYQDESSTSEHFFIPKSFIKLDKEDHGENSVSTECRINIPSVGATAENIATKSNQNLGISPLLKTSPPTFALFHVPNFEKESLEMRSSKAPNDGSPAKKVDEGLQQAKAALKTVHQQKVVSVPLRNADVEHRPSFLLNRDRANEKDWNGRFWCVDNRSRVLSFMIADERQC
nr:hypothetical transcript [Hymenolepis microstoma]